MIDQVKALVVEDDSEIVNAVADVLSSLGHQYDAADNQEDARRLVESDGYAYVLLDLEIPARPTGSLPRIANGQNLLQQIRRVRDMESLPVIVITGHGTDGPDLAVDMMKLGANDYVTKPFPATGRTLDGAIQSALRGKVGRRAEDEGTSEAGAAGALSPFKGATLTLRPDRAELDGVVIITDRGTGYSLKLLQELAKKGRKGMFVRRDAERLAKAMGLDAGDGQVTGSARTLRRNVRERLRRHLRVDCDAHRDFLVRDSQGYYLSEKIRLAGSETKAPAGTSANVPAKNDPAKDDPAKDVPAKAPQPRVVHLNERQQWVMAELRKGLKLQRKMLEDHFSVSEKTAKRDLSVLTKAGLVTYVSQGRTGHYKLASD